MKKQPAMKPKRLFDFIFFQQRNHPLKRSLVGRYQGEEVAFSTEQVIEAGYKVARGLLELGVKPGDRLAMVTYRNRPEWSIMDLGMQMIGAVNVPVYPTISSEEYSFIFADSGVTMAFVGAGDLYDKVEAAATHVEKLHSIYTFDPQPGRKHWEELFRDGSKEEVDKIRERISEEELATLIYTSGTTGKPKGVMLSHRNIVSNVFSIGEVFPCEAGDVAISFLPLCHIFARCASYVYQYIGIELVFVGIDNLGGPEGDLMAVRPHYFNSVPRLLEKVHDKILLKGSELSPLKRWLFYQAIHFTEKFEYDKEYKGMDRIRFKLYDRLVYSKWRAALGGRIKGMLSGAAPCPANILRFFSAAGIPLREGYGLTETSPGLAVGRFEKGGAKIGTVGPAIRDVRLRIDTEGGEYREGEGEVLANGPNIMMGYYRRPEEDKKVFVEIAGEKWFRTGDIGRMVKGTGGREFLQITDRKKELLKTSGGKYVAPSPIEISLKEHLLVEQAMVVGDKLKFVSALILPTVETLQGWCKKHDVSWTNLEKVLTEPKVVARFQHIVDEVNQSLSHTEKIKKFKLLAAPWEPFKADGSDAELTPTLKLKRRVILKKHNREIEEMYAG